MDYDVALVDLPVTVPKAVVITIPLERARKLMADLAELNGDRIEGWTLFGALNEAGVTPSYVSAESPRIGNYSTPGEVSGVAGTGRGVVVGGCVRGCRTPRS